MLTTARIIRTYLTNKVSQGLPKVPFRTIMRSTVISNFPNVVTKKIKTHPGYNWDNFEPTTTSSHGIDSVTGLPHVITTTTGTLDYNVTHAHINTKIPGKELVRAGHDYHRKPVNMVVPGYAPQNNSYCSPHNPPSTEKIIGEKMRYYTNFSNFCKNFIETQNYCKNNQNFILEKFVYLPGYDRDTHTAQKAIEIPMSRERISFFQYRHIKRLFDKYYV